MRYDSIMSNQSCMVSTWVSENWWFTNELPPSVAILMGKTIWKTAWIQGAQSENIAHDSMIDSNSIDVYLLPYITRLTVSSDKSFSIGQPPRNHHKPDVFNWICQVSAGWTRNRFWSDMSSREMFHITTAHSSTKSSASILSIVATPLDNSGIWMTSWFYYQIL